MMLQRRNGMKLVTASTMFVGVTAGTLGGFCVARSFFTDAAASAEGPTGSSSSTVDIISYNVLSPTLARADYYNKCDAADLDKATRLRRVMAQLDAAMAAGTGVFCLQEVAVQWAGPLHAYFENKGYHLVYASHGSPFSDFMGVAVAWDTTRFSADSIEIAKIGPEIKPLVPRFERDMWTRFVDYVLSRPPPRNVWDEASRRRNQAILARLASKSTGETFAVGCYHMPCLFGNAENVQVMNLHLQVLAEKLERFAAGAPRLLAGDFNIQPDSSPYQLITTGALPDGHPEVAVHPEDKWKLGVSRLRSAYKEHLGAEPPLTNHAFSGKSWFTGTLDYVFVSEEWKVLNVVKTPAEAPAESFPNAEQPSDHVLIGAKLSLA